MARKWAQLITSMTSITRWNMRQTFSSLGLYMSVSEALEENFIDMSMSSDNKGNLGSLLNLTVHHMLHDMWCKGHIHETYLLTLTLILYSHRDSNPTRYEIKSELSLEDPGVIGRPFNFTFQVRVKRKVFTTHLINDEKLILLGNNLDNLFLCCLSDPEPWILSSEGSTAEHWDPRDDKKWESAPANIWLSYRPGGWEAWLSDLQAE